MIYLDTSVALTHLLGETRAPRPALWSEMIVSSRLLEYEVWTRIHGRGLSRSHGDLVRQLLAGIALVELAPNVVARALEPFPSPVRTLDALHLATVEFLRAQRQEVVLASYDERMIQAGRALGMQIWE